MKKNITSPRVLMLSTSAKGGMATVVTSYEKDGFFDRQNVFFLSTHSDGSWYQVLGLFLKSYVVFMYQILFKRVKLIHIHSASKGSFWRKSIFAVFGFIFRIPVIFHLHGANMESFYASLPRLLQSYTRWIFEKSSCVIVLSQSWAEFIIKIAPKAKIEIVNNYVSLPCVFNKKNENKKVLILFLGIVGKRKGVYDILDAVAEVIKKHTNFEVLIGGNGETEALNNEIKLKGLGGFVKLLGWVGSKQKEKLLEKADIYILPSYNEGLPMSLLEAMSWEVPVISTNVGGIPELIRNNLDGFVVEPGDVQALIDVLLRLIKSSALRLDMGKSARSRVEEQFSDLVVIPQLEQIYAKLLVKG